MYQIFVNDKPIILTTESVERAGCVNFPLKGVDIEDVISVLDRENVECVILIHKKQKKLLKKFLKLLPVVIAGGGKVYNEKNKILFIYRNKKWDLPKGKAEDNESIQQTAMREVEEETKVEGLEIIKPLPITYHIFKRNGKYKIKKTYWFEMKTKYKGDLEPQLDEGITKVKWLGEKKTKKALKKSYANIRQLFY